MEQKEAKILENIIIKLVKKLAKNNIITYEDIKDLELDNEEYILFLEFVRKENIKVDFKQAVKKIEKAKKTQNIDNVKDSDDLIDIYYKDSSFKTFSKEEERKYFSLYKHTKSQDLKRLLAECNFALVISIANRYRNKGLEYLDLIQEGNIGLMEAIEKYDVEKGTAFSTYATYLIKHYITKALSDKSRTIRIPANMSAGLVYISQARKNLEKQLLRKPTKEEIANYLGITKEKVMEIINSDRQVLSLEGFKIEDDEVSIIELLEDPEETLIEDEISDKLFFNSIMQEITHVLSEKELHIILERNGVGLEEPMVLEKIGKELGITKERVRQIEHEAYGKIRRRLHNKGIENPYGEKIKNRVY